MRSRSRGLPATPATDSGLQALRLLHLLAVPIRLRPQRGVRPAVFVRLGWRAVFREAGFAFAVAPLLLRATERARLGFWRALLLIAAVGAGGRPRDQQQYENYVL